jgi:phytoene dehydrogenase-like protein
MPVRINIIGAGVSGLSLGCYLQMNGFKTEIFEKQSHSGGLCCSWQRGDFTFDGCIHWLLGSNESNPFYRLWCELVDMKSVQFVHHDVRVEIELSRNRDRYGNKIFHLYTDINRLESYLLDLAPEDARLIKSLVRSMRLMQKFELPPLLDSKTGFQSWRKKLSMLTYLPVVLLFLKWGNVTNYTFARGLKNPFLKEAFELLLDGEEFKLLIMTMPLSFFDSKGAGYPLGGSLQFAKRIEDKYIALGGEIHYNHEVNKIITEDRIAKGILLKNNGVVYSDITISAADWHFTVFEALEGKFVNEKLLSLAAFKKLQLYPSILLISLGVRHTFREYPHLFRFPLDVPVTSPDGTVYSRLESHIYHYDPTLAPEGKTIIVLSLYTRNGEYWIGLRNTDREEYDRRKNEFAGEIIDRLEEKIRGVKKSIEIMDIATPATYHRYTNNWKGSVQGWFPDSNLMASSPVGRGLPGLSGFYYSSHWSIPGGGLPMALKASRDLAVQICQSHNKAFVIR